MKLSLSINDICKLVVTKYAPGNDWHANFKTPPEGLNPDTEVLTIEIKPPGSVKKQPPTQPPPQQPPTGTIRVSPG